jgi:hypothetical protein
MAQKPDRHRLSGELGEYLISLSVALQRHAMYPDGHPSLGPVVDGVVRRAQRLLEDRSSLAFGVARRQLVVEGVTTDPEHPVLRRLAEELHRHHLGAVTVSRGVHTAEIREVLRVLASEPERAGAAGLTSGRAQDWPHVKLHPLTFDGLAIVGDAPLAQGPSSEGSGQGTLSAELWVGLARAAISAGTETAPETIPLDPTAVARSIDERQGAEAYDQVVVGFITQIARELRTSSGAETEALRRRTSRLVRDLRPETLRRIVEMGGDVGQRAAFVLDSAEGMSGEAALDVVKAAAEAGGQTISHSLVRMLSKLAAHTDEAPSTKVMAGEALREQVGRLMADWTLEDPNPESHRLVLQRFATAARGVGRTVDGRVFDDYDAVRIVKMSLESGAGGPLLDRAVDEAVAVGQVPSLLAMLASPPEGAEAIAGQVRARMVQPANVSALLASEPLDLESLDSLLPFMTPQGYEPLLDALSSSQSRATRRKILERLAAASFDLSEAVGARLSDQRWWVQRNMLVLLERYGRVPAGVSMTEWGAHADPRVRCEAIRVQLAMPGERDAAIRAALGDADARVLRVGLAALARSCPSDLVGPVAHLAVSSGDSEIRVLAVQVLGGLQDESARDALLRMADGGRTFFGRHRLPPRTPALVAVVRALAATWSADSRTAVVLGAARRSSDRELAEAAHPGVR